MSFAYWLGKNRLYFQLTNKLPGSCTNVFQERGPGFKIEGFEKIEKEPTAQEIVDYVEYAYENDKRKLEGAKIGMGENDEGIAYAGLGDPLLRLDTVLEATEKIRENRHGIPIRLNTTALGLTDMEKTIIDLKNVGIDVISVFIPSADPLVYRSKMNAQLSIPSSFISICSENEMKTRVVTIASPGNDVEKVRKLAYALGAMEVDIKSYVA